jgi:hypothetical protein
MLTAQSNKRTHQTPDDQPGKIDLLGFYILLMKAAREAENSCQVPDSEQKTESRSLAERV